MDSLNYNAKSVPTFKYIKKNVEALHTTSFPCESKTFTHINETCVNAKKSCTHLLCIDFYFFRFIIFRNLISQTRYFVRNFVAKKAHRFHPCVLKIFYASTFVKNCGRCSLCASNNSSRTVCAISPLGTNGFNVKACKAVS